MNLAICTAGELFGGVERQVLDLCRFYRRNGIQPTVVLFHDRELAAQLRDIGMEPAFLVAKHRYDPSVVNQLIEIVRRDDIQTIHVHGYRATITSGMARGKVPFRLIKTEHGKLEPTLANPLAWAKSRFNFWLEQKFTKSSVEAIGYVTQDISESYDGLHRGLNRRTIHNGMDPLDRNQFQRPDELDNAVFNVGIVGRVSRVKGIPVAFEALASLQDPGIHLQIIGTGPQLGELKAEVENSGLGSNVHFLGFRTNIHEYLAHLDALLMPSFHEGLPYTLLEALSLGRPVLVSRVGGLAEVLTDGQDALLFPSGDADALAQALGRIRKDTDLAQALGSAGRILQNEKFTLDAMGAGYLSMINGS